VQPVHPDRLGGGLPGSRSSVPASPSRRAGHCSRRIPARAKLAVLASGHHRDGRVAQLREGLLLQRPVNTREAGVESQCEIVTSHSYGSSRASIGPTRFATLTGNRLHAAVASR